jgi:hypothetical protein
MRNNSCSGLLGRDAEITPREGLTTMSPLPSDSSADAKADPERLREWVSYLAETIGCRPATRPDLL